MRATRPSWLRRTLALLCAVAFLFAGSGFTFAQKTVHVKSYVKKNGTVVVAHDRKAPGSATTTPTASSSKPRTSSGSSGSHATATRSTSTPAAKITPTTPRPTGTTIQRSEAAKRAFMKSTGYPHGRPGFVIDHIVALACGGPDTPANMQWQTIAAGKAKDKVERKGCGR